MRKRFSCALLVLSLVVLLLPTTVIRAHAQENLSTSEEAIAFIKDWEGFSPKAYWDISQWTIGYGTAGTAGQTITEEEADAAMRAHIQKVDVALNSFIASKNLNLNQAQFDALSSFSYNCGILWTRSSGRFMDAILGGYTGNDFLFAISLWANAGSNPDPNLLWRRMSEANLYLNGVYAKKFPGDYAFTIFNANGGVPGHSGEDKMQGYIRSGSEIKVADPTRTGSKFGGWYTAPTGGNPVTRLDTSTHSATLYAKWGTTVKVLSFANVRSGPGVAYPVSGSVESGQSLDIVEVRTVDNALWGQFSGGWLALMYTDYAGQADQEDNDFSLPDTSKVVDTGTVHCDTYVNLRSGPGTEYPLTGKAFNGKTLNLYEIKDAGSRKWGKTIEGWICLDYVRLASQPEAAPPVTTPPETTTPETEPTNPSEESKPQASVTGVVNATQLNIRQSASVNSPKVGSYPAGQTVTILETQTVNNVLWGKTNRGWVCMSYVNVQETKPEEAPAEKPQDKPTETPEEKPQEAKSGKVTSQTNLNVRTGPGVNYDRVKSLTPGTVVTITEQQTQGGITWGRIGDNQWVCMQYIALTDGAQTPPAGSEKPSEDQQKPPAETQTPAVTEGVVIGNTRLNVRSGPGVSYDRVDSLNVGTKVEILETSKVNEVLWGRIGDNRWVCLQYIGKEETSSNTDSTVIATGTVTCTTNLNIRSGPGVNFPKVGSLTPGTSVSIYETKTEGSMKWAKIKNGWVSMDYIRAGSL